jgi:glycosyltransferase involved in cell wall biosynthesis
MISVCLASYNGQKFIKEQIASILSQLTSNDELIISDDSSTDATIEIIESFSDNRIIILKNPGKGILHNFENAMRSARGDFIFLSDQDDMWHPNKVQRFMQKFSESNCDLILSDCYICDEFLNNSRVTFFDQRRASDNLFLNIIRNSFIGCCLGFNRKILTLSLPFPKKIPMHDQWIGLQALKYGKVELLLEPLLYYRRHENNASQTGEISQASLFQQMIWRYQIIKAIL